MTYQKINEGFILRFSKNEKLVEKLKTFIIDQEITGAWLTALGAAEGVTLGYYHLSKKEYHFKTVTKLLEITNLTGNVAYNGKELVIHMHGTFSDEHLNTIGGHVSELIVGGTVEMRCDLIQGGGLKRKHDPTTGLNLLDLEA